MTERHTGGCLCGAVRYETTGRPLRVSACACAHCQRRTGSAFGLGVFFRKPDVRFAQGDLKSFRLRSDGDRWLENQFCPTCGTTIGWTMELFPDLRAVAGGTFDPPSFWYDLSWFVFARSKPDWLVVPNGLECHDTAPYHPSMIGR